MYEGKRAKRGLVRYAGESAHKLAKKNQTSPHYHISTYAMPICVHTCIYNLHERLQTLGCKADLCCWIQGLELSEGNTGGGGGKKRERERERRRRKEEKDKRSMEEEEEEDKEDKSRIGMI
jgi:hypothetical protein